MVPAAGIEFEIRIGQVLDGHLYLVGIHARIADTDEELASIPMMVESGS